MADDKPFKFDVQGNIVGPGLFVAVRDQIGPGVIALDVDLLNTLYDVGFLAGKEAEAAYHRRQRDRVADVIADLMPEEDF